MADDLPTSATLLERLRGRDPEAWRRLLDLYGPLVLYWCGRLDVRGADAEDVRQEVLGAVAEGLERFRRERPGEGFRAWLRGITRHKLLDHFRRAAQEPQAPGGTDAQRRLQNVADDTLPPLDEPPAEVSSLYHRALDLVRGEFEGRTWAAFWRTAVEGEKASAVAAGLGMTALAVRKAKSRVLHRLRQEVGDLID